MFTSRVRFHEFKSQEGEVLLWVNEPCRIFGIRDIDIKIFDSFVRKLHNVRYVLSLKWNIILVGMLETFGYVFKIVGGVMKVIKGVITFM